MLEFLISVDGFDHREEEDFISLQIDLHKRVCEGTLHFDGRRLFYYISKETVKLFTKKAILRLFNSLEGIHAMEIK